MELHEQSDSAIVESIQAGDDAAFDELIRRYKKPVVNFVYRMLGDADEADDIAQEVFVRVYQHIGDYEPRTKFSTWLFALAHNAAVDRLRWRKRHPTESLDAAVPVPTHSSVAAEVNAHEIGAQVAAAVATLPEDQRTAVVLSEYHGMSYAEIAKIMHCSAKSVESRLYRAKQTLRERLKFLLD
jgi:RNA polymerase sigma-70 factor (ECF subfamily)